ncbi:MAG TPA: TfoX/Sxy family protein [Rhizomicrobium sp.]
MAITAGYRDWLGEIFAGLGTVTVRRFFDLEGLYCEGSMFGLVAQDHIYLKADDDFRDMCKAEGCAPLVYRMKTGGEIVTSYFAVPDRLYDDREELLRWAGRALAAARNSPRAVRKRHQSRIG